MDIKEQIVEFIRTRGPVIPVQVAKYINSTILIASAHLAELKANTLIETSYLKIGDTPLYYLREQKIRLQSFANNLGRVERKVYDSLRENKVLRESIMEPSLRVAIKTIKDFAIPLQVNYQGKSEIFWKWYLVDDTETEHLIKGIMKPAHKITEKLPPSDKLPEEITKEKHLQSISEKREKREKLKNFIDTKKDKLHEQQKTLDLKKIGKKKSREKSSRKNNILNKKIEHYFSNNKIEIIEGSLDSKGDIVVHVPSPIGSLRYFCRIKNKKKINDGDLSSLFIHAQSRKLPSLLITSGELTKKSKEMIEGELKGMIIIQL